jgi:GNAT superfamily N-acetyltransferase
MPFSFRSAVLSDAEAIGKLFSDTVRTVLARFYCPEQAEIWSAAGDLIPFWEERIDTCWFEVAVDESTGLLAGFCQMDAAGCIDMLYVSTLHQGRGVGVSLLAHAEMEARNRSLHWLTADVSLSARPLFERCGFVLLQEQHGVAAGKPFVNFKMLKDLDEVPDSGMFHPE